MQVNTLNFRPLPGLASRHVQTIVSCFFPAGKPPPFKEWHVDLGSGDYLCCTVSTPPKWKRTERTVVLIHGMGGSHDSGYMIRMSRKLYLKGIKVVRVNLRGAGPGKGLSKLLYHAGTSEDMLKVLHGLKVDAPASEIVVIGFSLGGNIALKLAGELGGKAKELVKAFIAVCAPMDLAQTVRSIQEKRNRLYHSYYLKTILDQAGAKAPQNIQTIVEFDDLVTAPHWGYQDSDEYYRECSSIRFLPRIQQSTHLLFSRDDPFICMDAVHGMSLPHAVQVWTAEQGGHMGFLGWTSKPRSFFWMDDVLLKWIDEDFSHHRLEKVF